MVPLQRTVYRVQSMHPRKPPLATFCRRVKMRHETTRLSLNLVTAKMEIEDWVFNLVPRPKFSLTLRH